MKHLQRWRSIVPPTGQDEDVAQQLTQASEDLETKAMMWKVFVENKELREDAPEDEGNESPAITRRL
jgi:hypothetical protein